MKTDYSFQNQFGITNYYNSQFLNNPLMHMQSPHISLNYTNIPTLSQNIKNTSYYQLMPFQRESKRSSNQIDIMNMKISFDLLNYKLNQMNKMIKPNTRNTKDKVTIYKNHKRENNFSFMNPPNKDIYISPLSSYTRKINKTKQTGILNEEEELNILERDILDEFEQENLRNEINEIENEENKQNELLKKRTLFNNLIEEQGDLRYKIREINDRNESYLNLYSQNYQNDKEEKRFIVNRRRFEPMNKKEDEFNAMWENNNTLYEKRKNEKTQNEIEYNYLYNPQYPMNIEEDNSYNNIRSRYIYNINDNKQQKQNESQNYQMKVNQIDKENQNESKVDSVEKIKELPNEEVSEESKNTEEKKEEEDNKIIEELFKKAIEDAKTTSNQNISNSNINLNDLPLQIQNDKNKSPKQKMSNKPKKTVTFSNKEKMLRFNSKDKIYQMKIRVNNKDKYFKLDNYLTSLKSPKKIKSSILNSPPLDMKKILSPNNSNRKSRSKEQSPSKIYFII